MANNSTPKYIRHYCNKEAADGIKKDGKIKPGQNANNYFGPGTYLTGISPRRPKEEILNNNYTNPRMREKAEIEGRADCRAKVDINTLDKSKLKKLPDPTRDVYYYPRSVLVDPDNVGWTIDSESVRENL